MDQLTDASEKQAEIDMTNESQLSETSEAAASDREWRAARYVLGELPETEAEAFELAMLDDSGLCELVLNAARLQIGIIEVLGDTSRSTGKPVVVLTIADQSPSFMPDRSRTARVAVSLAGLGLAGILLTFATVRGRAPIELSVVNPETVNALADLISESETSDLLALQEVDTDVDPALSEVAAPEWLLTAIELENGTGQPPSSDESDVY